MTDRDLLAVLLAQRPHDFPDADLLEGRRPTWWAAAACRGVGPQDFYVEGRSGTYGPSTALCEACEARAPCAEQGSRERFGWWGGMPARQRQALRRGAA
jgi:hypothetical protein